MHPTATSNEDFLAEFRDWCSQHKLSSTDIEYQVSYISELGDFMAPVPLSQVTKAVLYDFHQEQHARSRESHVNIMRAAISLDAFRADKRRGLFCVARPNPEQVKVQPDAAPRK